MPTATEPTPPPLCNHLRGYLLAPANHTTSYQPIWRCQLCNQDIRLEDLLVPWSNAIARLNDLTEVLGKRVADLEAYWDQEIDLSEAPNDGR